MGNIDILIGCTYDIFVSTVSFIFVFVAVSLPKLQQIAKIKAQQVPTLSILAPYLELSTKQDYLVSRIQGMDFLEGIVDVLRHFHQYRTLKGY